MRLKKYMRQEVLLDEFEHNYYNSTMGYDDLTINE